MDAISRSIAPATGNKNFAAHRAAHVPDGPPIPHRAPDMRLSVVACDHTGQHPHLRTGPRISEFVGASSARPRYKWQSSNCQCESYKLFFRIRRTNHREQASAADGQCITTRWAVMGFISSCGGSAAGNGFHSHAPTGVRNTHLLAYLSARRARSKPQG